MKIYTRRETNIQDYITRTYWIQYNRLIQNGKLTFFLFCFIQFYHSFRTIVRNLHNLQINSLREEEFFLKHRHKVMGGR